MKAELHACKVAAAAAAAVILLLLASAAVNGLVQEAASDAVMDGAGCAVVSRSTTFQGDCGGGSEAACADACTNESYPEGYCFVDIADPDHPVCMCSGPCPAPSALEKPAARGSPVV